MVMNIGPESSVTQTHHNGLPLFKVLGQDGASCHGGAYPWSLPTQQGDGSWTPGDWTTRIERLEMCASGYHLTTEPARWQIEDGRLFAVEYRGQMADEGGDKVAVQEARLLRECDWSEGQVFTAGRHQVRQGLAVARGTATVRASGSATVEAWDSATVEAWDSATVRASDSATVRASDSATVRASDSATVRASGSATVISDWYHSPSAEVALTQMAAHVDRRGGRLVLRRAEGRSDA